MQTTISDDADIIKAVLSATASTSEDSGSITYTVNLVDASSKAAIAKEDVVIALTNGEIIVIKAGTSTGSIVIAVNKDDVYKETDLISNTIKTITGTGVFEKLEADVTEVNTIIVDDIDNLNVKLSGDTFVTEGGDAVYKVSLSDDLGNAVKAIADM